MKGKEWLQSKLEELIVYKNFSNQLFEEGKNPVIGKYNSSEVDDLVAQLGKPIIENEQINLLEENS